MQMVNKYTLTRRGRISVPMNENASSRSPLFNKITAFVKIYAKIKRRRILSIIKSKVRKILQIKCYYNKNYNYTLHLENVDA